jgi:hypothetical protein
MGNEGEDRHGYMDGDIRKGRGVGELRCWDGTEDEIKVRTCWFQYALRLFFGWEQEQEEYGRMLTGQLKIGQDALVCKSCV